MLALLGLHPDVTQKVREEISQIIGDRKPEYDDFKEMHYLDYCMKESLR